MKKILCVLPQITGGGAERFLISFLNNIDTSKYTLSLVLAQRGMFDNEIPKDVDVSVLRDEFVSTKVLAPTGPLRYLIGLTKSIQRLNPDAIISFGSLLNGSVSLAAKISKFSGKVLLIEAIHESSELEQHNFINKALRKFFLQKTYPLASNVIAVSEDVALDLKNYFQVESNVKVIHYGIELEKVRSLSRLPVEHPWLKDDRDFPTLVACGRVVPQKGFNVLLATMENIPKDAKLILVGDGPEIGALKEDVRLKNLTDRVEFVGYDRNPYKYIVKADAFVMPSLWEGLPILLIEAITLGAFIIVSDCPSGPRVVLKGGECGVLVEPGSVESLAVAINKFLENPSVAKALKEKAYARSIDFSIETSIANYLSLVV